jgi:hypothetical protein
MLLGSQKIGPGNDPQLNVPRQEGYPCRSTQVIIIHITFVIFL